MRESPPCEEMDETARRAAGCRHSHRLRGTREGCIGRKQAEESQWSDCTDERQGATLSRYSARYEEFSQHQRAKAATTHHAPTTATRAQHHNYAGEDVADSQSPPVSQSSRQATYTATETHTPRCSHTAHQRREECVTAGRLELRNGGKAGVGLEYEQTSE